MIKAKRDYFRELKDNLFRKEQQQKLWRLIADTFREMTEPKQTFWINRMHRYYARRFYYLTKCEWIPYLGSFDDSQAYGSYRDLKSKRYCVAIRDRAAGLCRSLDEEKVVKITDNLPERA